MADTRPWQLEDLEACGELATVQGIAHQDKEPAWNLSHYQSSFNTGHLGFVAIQEQCIVGCVVASVVFEVADLLYIQVSPAAQGSGVAQELFQSLVWYCQEHKVERILLEVRPSNKRAIAFYRRLHFTEIDRRKAYYAATQNRVAEDALILQLGV